MIFLLFSIASSVLLFVVFRQMKNFEINNFHAVVINYFTAGMVGLLFFSGDIKEYALSIDRVGVSFLMGSLFIGIFYLMLKTTQEYGISVGSVANKMAVVMPVVAAVILYGTPLTPLKVTGVILALAGLYLTNVKSDASTKKLINILPLAVFIGSGIIDTLLSFAALKMVTGLEGAFSTFTFFTAGLIGALVLFIKKKRISAKSIKAGIILGVVNFATIFFVLKALNSKVLDEASFFPVNNVSIVLGSVFVSVLFFKEKLNKRNILGVFCAAAAILLLGFTL